MTLEEIIKIADDHYPDGLIQQAQLGEDVGDGLASFIAAELEETYDEEANDSEQLLRAITVLSTASHQLLSLVAAFARIRANLVKVCKDED